MMTISVPSLLGLLDGLEGDGGRILALLLRAHDLGARALGPGRELLDGRRAERVGRADDDGAVVGAQELGELADRGRLADAVDADDQHDRRTLGELERGVELREPLLEGLAQHPLQVGRVGGVVAVDLGAQVVDDRLGHIRSEVGGDERRLEVVPGVVVDRLLREHAAEGARQRPGGAFCHDDQSPLVVRCEHVLASCAVSAELAEQLRRAWRPAATDAVHQARTRVRRLRSILSVYRRAFAARRTERMRAPARGSAPPSARRATSRCARDDLDDLLAGARRAPDVVDAVRGAGRTDARERARRGASPTSCGTCAAARTARLLADLQAFAAAPPLAQARQRSIRGAWRRNGLAKAAQRRARTAAATSLEELHELRKAARRLRYAAEAVADTLGRDAVRIVRCAAEAVQDALGDHRDLVLLAQPPARAGAETELSALRPSDRAGSPPTATRRAERAASRPRATLDAPLERSRRRLRPATVGSATADRLGRPAPGATRWPTTAETPSWRIETP